MSRCCAHSVERHAYNGCANCSCNVTWLEHPDRDQDQSPEGRSTLGRLRAEDQRVGSILTKHQTKTFGPRPINGYGYGTGSQLTVTIRYDDSCGNGHNTFSITGEIRGKHGRWLAGGCLHDDIARVFPELAPLIRWHLVSSDGPMHYIANTLYWLGYQGFCDGKSDSPPNLAHARKVACWPDMPESMLSPGRMVLADASAERPAMASTSDSWIPDQALEVAQARQRFETAKAAATRALEERLPTLLVEFRAAVESLGFVW